MKQKDVQNNVLLRQNIDLQEDERRIIADELHNEIGQNLTAIRTAAQLMSRQSEGRQTHPLAESIVELTDQMYDIMHRMLHRLNPSVLEKLGFEESLEDLVAFAKKNMQLDCSLSMNGNLDLLDKDLQLAAYRIIQEALINSVRHGLAKQAEIKIEANDKQLVFSVTNDGQPLNNELEALIQNKSTGIGLLGIKHRIEAWQGEIKFENVDGAVVLSCAMPLEA